MYFFLWCAGIDFELIEHDPYNKSEEWLKINPRGLVPVIIYEGKSIYESPVCIEFVEDLFPEKTPHLLPQDPYLKAKARLLSDHLSKKVVPLLWAIMLKQTAEEQNEGKVALVKGIIELMRDADQTGPFLMGAEPSLPDFMLAPFAWRIDVVLPYYRDFSVPGNGKSSNMDLSEDDLKQLRKYHEWYANFRKRDSFTKTLVSDEKIIESLRKYANNTAKSQVAQSFNKGKAAP